MGLAEGDALADEVVGHVGREQGAVLGGLAHAVRVHGAVAEHAAHGVEGCFEGVDGVEEAFLVLLEVAVVGEREALEGGEQADEAAVDAARLAARDLREVRVALLGHDG